MSNNFSNTVAYKLNMYIVPYDYIVLKCDNIKPRLLEEIKQKAKTKGKKLILIREPDNNVNLVKYINYLYPAIPKEFVLNQIKSDILSKRDNNITKSILFFAGLKDVPDNFILSIAFGKRMLFTYFESSNLIERLDSHIRIEEEYFYKLFPEFEDSHFSVDYVEDQDENIKINESTKKIMLELIKQIDALKESGDYLMVLPIIEAYLRKIDDTKLIKTSSVLIDAEYKIFLVDFDNLEVKLNSLTKCIYLLFLNHPKGILLSELILHKGELIEYYLEVSNSEDYDLMRKRIDKIIDLKSNEIYVHLSRIKSFFYKKYDKKIADDYIITGAKSRPKAISLKESKIKWMPRTWLDDFF